MHVVDLGGLRQGFADVLKDVRVEGLAALALLLWVVLFPFFVISPPSLLLP